MDMDYYGITAVSRQTGIHEASLRRWESLGLLKTERIELGSSRVRVYTPDDIDLLHRVKELMDDGMTLRAAFDWATGNVS
jgi:DNA-binding transcriptional MerR regulator